MRSFVLAWRLERLLAQWRNVLDGCKHFKFSHSRRVAAKKRKRQSQRAMEPGIRTREWTPSTAAVTPTVVCRDCQARLTLEESEEHDCSVVPQPPPSPTKTMLVKTVTRAESILGTLFDTPHRRPSPATLRPPEETPAIGRASEKVSVRTSPALKAQASDGSPKRTERLSSSTVTATSASSVFSAFSASSASSVGTDQQMQHSRVDYCKAEDLSPLRCTVGDVHVSSDRVALYSVVSVVPTLTTSTVTVERRFREFYAFALQVYAMFTSEELWQRLPPKTYCSLRRQHTLTDGFLERRKAGLDDFLRSALDEMVLGVHAQGSIAQWYVLRRFLNLPSALVPTKDRNLLAAMNELKKHARQSSGWTVARKVGTHDTIFEKVAGSFPMVKRITTCHFPARAVFDMLMKQTTICNDPSTRNSSGVFTICADSGQEISAQPATSTASTSWAPFVESKEVLKRDGECTWTEKTILKNVGWRSSRIQLVTRICWRMDEGGVITVVMIPAEDADWSDSRVLDTNSCRRVDCILGGWLISPSHHEDGCSVTWLMQANFGECNPRAEFTGKHGRLTSFLARRSLLAWADELTHLLQMLGKDSNHHAC